MSRRACILNILTFTKRSNIIQTLYELRVHVRTETLISKDRQPLFECQLKPVSARDTITRPIMEILMGNHTLYSHKVPISRTVFIGKYIMGIKDIQSLVFHSPHVETVNGNNVVYLQVILTTVRLFIPRH